MVLFRVLLFLFLRLCHFSLPAQEPRGPWPRLSGAATRDTTGGTGLTHRPYPCCLSSGFSSGCQACLRKTPPWSRHRVLVGPRLDGSTTPRASHRLAGRPNARSRVWRAPANPGVAMVRDRPGNKPGARSRATDGGEGHNRGNEAATGDLTRGADRRIGGTASDRRGPAVGSGRVLG